MKKKKVNYLLLIIFLIFLIATTNLLYKHITIKLANKNNKEMVEELSKYEKPTEEEEVRKYIKGLKEKYNNNDIVGVLEIPKLNLTVPLLQGNNNRYYLSHLINHKYGLSTVFVDYRTDLDKAKQINIYGHNSNVYDLPFKALLKYMNKKNYSKEEYIIIGTENGITKYQIFSVAIVSDKFEHESIKFNSQDAWNKHFKKLKSDSKYETDVNVTGSDQVLVLQTCLQGKQKGSLLVISSKKVEGE